MWIFDKDGAAETLEGEWKAGRREGSFRHTYPWGRVSIQAVGIQMRA